MNKKWQVTILLTSIFSLSLALFTVRHQLWAAANGGGATVPSLISFQGLLADSNGDPLIDGSYDMMFAVYDAASSGTKIWEESQNGVAVSNGFFAVMLGNGSCTTGCPLGADDFGSATRYLQTSVDTGSGFIDFPRQQLTSAPYAFQAETAPWDGLTGVPPGFADGIDDEGSAAYENVITVAMSGGDFTSVANALDSITDSSATNPYLVRVMAGVYTETNLVIVKESVHVQGSGANATVVTSSRTGATPSSGAATVDLLDNGRLSNLTVRNEGTGTFGIALYSAQTSREAVADNIVAEAIGVGGTGHFAVYLNDAEITINNSVLRASGAVGFGTAVNTAVGIVNIAGGFPQPLIKNSLLTGGNNDPNGKSCAGNTGTGFGIQGTNAAPLVLSSYICGDRRGIFIGVNGQAHIHHSELWASTTSGSHMIETTASGTVLLTNSGVFHLNAGHKFTGTGGLVCTHNYLANYTPASDGTTSASACN